MIVLMIFPSKHLDMKNVISFICKGLCTLIFMSGSYLAFAQENVGIRTTQPKAPLHIFSSGQVATPGGLLLLGNRSEVQLEMDVNSLQVKFGLSNYSTLKLQELGGDVHIGNGRFFIDNDGAAIGVHTASPGAPFHVSSSGQVNTPGGLMLLGHRSEGHIEMDFNLLQSRFGAGSFLTLNLQQAGGNLDVGNGLLFVDRNTTRIGIHNSVPDYALDINGNAGINQYLHHNDDSNTYLNFTADRVRFTTGGKTLLSVLESFQDEVKLGDGSDVDINLNDEVYVNGLTDFVGINTSTPSSRLNINATGGESVLEGEVNDATIFQVHNNGGVSIGTGTLPPSNGLYVNGNVGVGTSNPNTKLHVTGGGNVGLGGGGYFVLGSQSSTNLAMDNNEIQCRQNGSAEDMWMQKNGGQLGIGIFPSSKLHVNSDANESPLFVAVDEDIKFAVNSSGSVGIGVSNPQTALDIVHPPTEGIKLRVTNESDFWRIDMDSADDDLNLYATNTYKGSFDSGSGDYISASDRRLKKDFEEMESSLSKIQLLKSFKYRYVDQDDSDHKSIGFIAQDVLDVFPELVHYSHDAGFYSLNYSGFAVVAIQAIQEQQLLLDQLQKENEEIRKELDEIKKLLGQRANLQSESERE
jgi:hypothetical protein